jgi:alginate O-acetyltransferase complex protein AlgI
MEITSVSFVVFVAGLVILFYLIPSQAYRLAVLTIANGIFIGTYISAPQQILPLLAFLCLSYATIEFTYLHRSGVAALVGISLILAAYVYLKQFSFIADMFSLQFSYIVVGLSYILFRIVHLIIDIRSGDITERIHPLAFLNYTCNFLCFVSGPIQRYQDFSRNLGQLPSYQRGDQTLDFVRDAFSRIISGYLKVIIISGIADYLFSRVSARILAPALTISGERLVMAYAFCTIAYTIYLYFNFSGYMDIVIGVGRLLGQELPENFNKPFLARNFLEFWTRWHMTLSLWFKTYLFNPLMGILIERVPQPALLPYLGVTAFFVTFFVMGIWHGTTVVFVIYGFLMGAGASINKLWQLIMVDRLGRKGYRALSEQSFYIFASRGLTCGFFMIGVTCLWIDMDQMRRLWDALGPAGVAGALLLTSTVCGFAMFLQDLILLPIKSWFTWPAGSSKRSVLGNFWPAAQVLLILIVSTFFSKAPEFVYRAF